MPLNPGVADVLSTPSAPSVVQNALGNGAAISYQIVAISGAGQDSIPSAATTTPANNASTANNTLTWTAVSGAAGYRVLKNGNLLANVGAGVTSYTDSAGSSGVSYTAATANPSALVISTNSPVDGGKATYSTSITALVPASSATDIFTITGSASKTIRILRVEVSGTQTTGGATELVLLKRSTANSSGTSTSPTAVAHDSNNPTASATINAYTANPTTGTLVGNIRAEKLFVAATTAASDKLFINFGSGPSQAVVLRGTSQVFAVNLNSATVTGGSFDINVEFSEE